jgi:hypothetical protein
MPMFVSENLAKELRKTKEVEYEILKNHRIDERSAVNFKLLMKRIEDKNLRPQTIFFYIDFKLYFRCFATATTFIIITCQFDANLNESLHLKNNGTFM